MTDKHYTRFAISLHWLMAILLGALLALGLYMPELPLSPWKLQIYSWHKWAGVTAFLLVIIRLVWRLSHQPPALPSTTLPLTRWLSHVGHATLYLLMIAIPLSGWLMSSAKGFQTVYFGILPIPDILSKDKALGETLKIIHEYLNYLFIALVTGHIAAVVKHQWLDKDNLLARMLFRRQF